MSYQEIAGICNCPVGTVGSWIHHGVRALRRMLGEKGQASASVPSARRLSRSTRCELEEQT
jgi:sigma-70-like protein